MGKYVLITAAKNEEVFIEKTIKAILSQTAKPAPQIKPMSSSVIMQQSISSSPWSGQKEIRKGILGQKQKL